MNDWTAGYTADVGYTYGYYQELNPLRVKLAFLNAGLVCPEFGSACELGFGQGLSLNMHAAASLTQWCGTDFNPAHAAFAKGLAAKVGHPAKIYDECFADFAQRSDLPEFDFIGLHGIWSWISDENRAVIVDFLHRKLKVGGVAYISYNTQPGWAAFAPMRHLMTEHAATQGSSGSGTLGRVDGALEFAEKILGTQPMYALANPKVDEKLKAMKSHNRQYLAHEYFNQDWVPMHYSTFAKWLSPAKLTYACSAHLLDHVHSVNLSTDQQAMLLDIKDPNFRETVRDFMVNQQFRRDYWVRGAIKLDTFERSEALRAQTVILTTVRDEVSLKVKGALGEATMNEGIYLPILDVLSDLQVHTLGDIEQATRGKNITATQLVEAIMILAGAGILAPTQRVTPEVKEMTARLNHQLCLKARNSGEISYLTSPLTGGGMAVPRFSQLFLLAIAEGLQGPGEWAQYAWKSLQMLGQNIVKNGAALQTPEENIGELTEQAQRFSRTQLPVLKALEIA